jgi:hypothetical protein
MRKKIVVRKELNRMSGSNETTIPYGITEAGKPEIKQYFAFRPTPVAKKKVKGIPGMDLTIESTVVSPRTSRAIRRSVNGSFGKERLLSSEFNL